MAWEWEMGMRAGAKVGACHRPPKTGDRALGFNALGTGLVFKNLPMRSGCGEL